MTDEEPPPHSIGQYQLGSCLGSGSFGEVFVCWDARGAEWALKLERRRLRGGRRRRGPSQTEYESRVYKLLRDIPGVPRCAEFVRTPTHNALIIERLGESLQDVFDRSNRQLAIDSVLAVGMVMLEQLQNIHDRGLVHRDIKPQNMLLGRERTDPTVYIIDFGLSKKFRNRDGSHIAHRTDKRGLTGTPRYASINALNGEEQSRRDDLESLAYVLIYLATGTLPWQGLRRNSKSENHRRILRLKRETPVADLCANTPPELGRFLQCVRGIKFAQRPPYEKLLSYLRRAHSRAIRN